MSDLPDPRIPAAPGVFGPPGASALPAADDQISYFRVDPGAPDGRFLRVYARLVSLERHLLVVADPGGGKTEYTYQAAVDLLDPRLWFTPEILLCFAHQVAEDAPAMLYPLPLVPTPRRTFQPGDATYAYLPTTPGERDQLVQASREVRAALAELNQLKQQLADVVHGVRNAARDQAAALEDVLPGVLDAAEYALNQTRAPGGGTSPAALVNAATPRPPGATYTSFRPPEKRRRRKKKAKKLAEFFKR